MRYGRHRELRRRDFFDTLDWLLARHRVCLRQRLYISVEGVEPRRKNRMSLEEEVRLQRQILEQMDRAGRRAFRGPLVLEMSVDTTEPNPPYAQSIAKNLLDLFARARPELGTGRRLIYADDEQVHGLSFWCRHGQENPRIDISATPLRCFRADLALAMEAERKLRREERQSNPFDLDFALDDLKDILDNERRYRELRGEDAYQSMLDFARFSAQKQLLGGTHTTLLDLGAMYHVGIPRDPRFAPAWAQMNQQLVDFFRRSRLRIHLDELPSRPGTSRQYVADVDAQVQKYLGDWGWILQPLRIPLALQVITKPSPLQGKAPPKHDLDNVVRSYVLPRIVEAFAPPSNLAWTMDLSRLSAQDAERWMEHRKNVPKESQITRYEAWRLPVDGNRGFVSVSLVPDIGDFWGPLIRMDEVIDLWEEAREREDEW